MRCAAAEMSLGLVIAAPDAAEKFGGRLEDHRIPSRAEIEVQNLYKRSQAPGGQREASSLIGDKFKEELGSMHLHIRHWSYRIA